MKTPATCRRWPLTRARLPPRIESRVSPLPPGMILPISGPMRSIVPCPPHERHRKYDSGAVGSFTHVTTLQGRNYSCELEVHADGYSLKSVRIYGNEVEPANLTPLDLSIHTCSPSFTSAGQETTMSKSSVSLTTTRSSPRLVLF